MKFKRRSWNRFSRLGRGRKKKLTWRRPTGRHNKMRDKRRGYASSVNIGYKKPKKVVSEKMTIVINTFDDLKKIKKGQKAILGKIGKKKRIELAKKAEEMRIQFLNFNAKKFLSENFKEAKK